MDYEPKECSCSCHDNDLVHVIACCDGQCSYCGRYFHGLEKHIEKEHDIEYRFQISSTMGYL